MNIEIGQALNVNKMHNAVKSIPKCETMGASQLVDRSGGTAVREETADRLRHLSSAGDKNFLLGWLAPRP